VKRSILQTAVLPGALAGIVGGLVFGAAMTRLGVLSTIGLVIATGSTVLDVAVHLTVAALIGASFGVLVWRQRPGVGETFFWGLAYGAFWWFVGPLTVVALSQGNELAWDLHTAQMLFPSFVGHILYGASTGLVFAYVQRRQHEHVQSVSLSSLLRGALAGLAAAILLGLLLDSQDQLLALAAMMDEESRLVAWGVTLGIGLLAGLGFALLFPRATDSAGGGLIRGMVYGFFWWVAGALTLLSLLNGHGLAWSAPAAREGFATWPGYLLFGAALALFYRWLDLLGRLLFSDQLQNPDEEGPGAQGLRAAGYGLQAGLAGGLLFTFVMVRAGFLAQVAGLLGTTSAFTGFIVHLVIAIIIGISYGLLFRHQAYDIASALGWGISYGLLWWVLGPLTLMPFLLGATPQWSAEVAATAYPSLVGHLLYGAGVGISFYLLERRYRPWWISRTQVDAMRVARRQEQVLTSAPALWTLSVIIALTVPILLGM
jgi:uncharacterized membrane protein YagU involved in acid resistance